MTNGRLALAALTLALAMAGPMRAQAQDGKVWHYSSYSDDRGRTHALLHYGVPETDDVAFQAECVANSGSGAAEVTIGADIRGFAQGDPLRLRFLAPGYEQTHDGFAFVPESGEGLHGVAFAVPNRDPFWGALAGMPSLSYSVAGGPAMLLPLRGSSRAVNEFNQMCLLFEGGGQSANRPAVQTAAARDPRWDTCEAMAGERSRNSDVPVTVTFRNRSEGYRSVMWIGFDGQPVNYANLNPGEEFTINTYVTHPWMFTDGPGNCIEMYMPQLGVEAFNISAPNRSFGAE